MVENTEPLYLTPDTPTEEPLFLGEKETPISPETATTRAYKIASSGSLPDKSYDDIYTGLTNGEEEQLRGEAALNKNLQFEIERRDQVVKLAASGKFDPTDLIALKSSLVSPGTVFERNYAAETVNELDAASERLPETSWALTRAMMPTFVQKTKEVTSDVIAKRNVAITQRENIEEEIQNQSWPQTFGNILPTMFQPYVEYQLRGRTPDVGVLDGGLLLGNNLDEQRKALFRESTVEDFEARLKNILSGINNPYIKKQFIDSVVGQSTDEKTVNNAFSVMGAFDYAALGSIGKSIFKGVKSAAMQAEVTAAAKDIIESAKGEPTVLNRIAATGDVGEAAVQQSKTNFGAKFKGKNDAYKDAIDALPSGLKSQAEDVKANPGSLAKGLLNMLEDNFYQASSRLQDTLTNIAKIRRIPLEQATEETMRALKEEVKSLYPELKNAILNVADPTYNPLTNTYHYDMQVGNHGATLFTNPQIAKNFAKVNGLDAKVEKQGLGYYLRVTKPLNETSEVLRDLLVNPKGRTKQGWKNGTLGWLRTAEDTLSFNERVHRKIAAYAQGELRVMQDAERKYIQRLKNGGMDEMTGQKFNFLSRKVIDGVNYVGSKLRLTNAKNKWDDLERTLEHNQSMYDPATIDEKTGRGDRGYFFKGVGELEQHYLKTFQRMPEFDEIQAYFAHKRLWEFDYAQRNLRVYTNKTRLGVEQHSFKVLGPNGEEIISPTFDGIRKQQLPHGEDLILVVGKNQGEEKIYRGDQIPTNLRRQLEARVSTGKKAKAGEIGGNLSAGTRKVLEIYDPENRPFEGFGKVRSERIRYVVVEQTEAKTIPFEQIPRRSGGHFEYDHTHYIKQAVIRPENIQGTFRHWYEGDNTVLALNIPAKGKDLTKKMNDVRQLLFKGDEVAAKELLERTLPFEWATFKGWFTGRGGQRPILDITEPFVMVPRDKSVMDISKDLERRYAKTFKDGTREGSLSRAYQVKFTGARDADSLKTVIDVGTKGNPIYKLSDADLVDPMPMMDRALSRMTNSNFMDDYKIASMERWIKEASEHLDHSDSELRYSPFYYFNHPKYKAGTPVQIRSSLESQRFKIKQFVGIPSYIDTALHSAAQHLIDGMYRTLGGFEGEGQGFKKGLALTPSWLLTRVTDPISFVRGMTFSFKLGLFALPQVLVQNMTWVTIGALAPKSVMQGASGALLHQWSRVNPRMVDHLDKYASKLGWKPGEWAEANRELRNTGFGHVGGEYIDTSNLSSYKTVKNAGQDFLHWGETFFRESEKNVRLGAWYTAFKEFRTSNPGGKISVVDREKILERADLLNTNMSRASASILNTGPLALTTQFLSYQMRLAEMFIGKRLTMAERARLAMVYTGVFGVGGPAAVTGLPFGDYLKKEAIKAGYVVGDNFVADIALNGFPAYLMAWVSGGGDIKKGNLFNFGNRYGSQGFEFLRDILREDTPWYRIIGGASQSVLANMLESLDPLFRWIGNVARDNADSKFPLRAEDVIAPLNEVTSVNAVRRLLQAYHTGHWLTKKGADLGETSVAKAAFMAATGMQDQAVDDMYLKREITKEQTAMQKDSMFKAVQQLRNSFQALRDKNPAAAEDYYRRAFAILEAEGFPKERYIDIIVKAKESLGSLMEDVDYNFYLRNVPEKRGILPFVEDKNNKATRQDAYKRQLQLNNERNQ